MEVRIVSFPETRVAVLEHRGPPDREHETALKLVEWRRQNGLPTDRHRSYGVHDTDPRTTPPAEHRVDFCVSVDREVRPNPQGVFIKVIPACRCAVAWHAGPRDHVTTAVEPYQTWMPASGEAPGDFPIFFHYVIVGPGVRPDQIITDDYLPMR